jgi:hypothetical protein
MGEIRTRHGDFLARQFEHTLVCTMPDLSYVPLGDTKAGGKGITAGPDGGVTHEMAGVLSGLTWALNSGQGVWFDNWIAAKRGLRRFYGETGIFYFLYARSFTTPPVEPPLAFFAGSRQGGEIVTRSGWGDGDTVVALRATDHFGSHNHFDQGSFVIYRQGMLAVDQTVYKKVGGAQQATETHNTLLIGGHGQRRVVGQNFRTVEAFQENLTRGKRLETGDLVYYRDTPQWTAATAQIAQAYPDGVVSSCLRQLLFIRPGVVLIVDQLAAPVGGRLGEVSWLLHLPAGAVREGGTLTADNNGSYLRCRQILPGNTLPERSEALTSAHERHAFKVDGGESLVLAHLMEIGDGAPPAVPLPVEIRMTADGLRVSLAGQAFLFGAAPDGHIESVAE